MSRRSSTSSMNGSAKRRSRSPPPPPAPSSPPSSSTTMAPSTSHLLLKDGGDRTTQGKAGGGQGSAQQSSVLFSSRSAKMRKNRVDHSEAAEFLVDKRPRGAAGAKELGAAEAGEEATSDSDEEEEEEEGGLGGGGGSDEGGMDGQFFDLTASSGRGVGIGGGRPRVVLDRPAMNEKQLHERFQYEAAAAAAGSPYLPWSGGGGGGGGGGSSPPSNAGRWANKAAVQPSAARLLGRAKQSCRRCSPAAVFLALFPILDWLPKYQWKKDLPSDLSAGFTVAVMHIPQGMAYALLANTDPIVGIYTAFFPVIVYIFMGTSPHISQGTFAVISILTSSSVEQFASDDDDDKADQLIGNATATIASARDAGGVSPSNKPNYTSVQVVTAVALAAGLWQVLFYFLRLSSFCSLLSHSLIRGFTTGAAIHVFSSQVRHLLGIKIERYNGPFALFKMYGALFGKLGETNLVTLLMSLTIVAALELYAQLLERRLTRLLRGVSFPAHLFVVAIGILVSHFAGLESRHSVRVVGHVKSGMPSPEPPPFELLPKVASNGCIVAVVSYVVSYSLATLMANRHKYKIRPSQELLANGVCNLVGSFFSSLPLATSLSRTLVQDDAGCRSLLTSATSVFLLLWVLLFAGPAFRPLPNAVLSAIIIHALKGMFKQFSDLPSLWAHSGLDLVVWLATFTATVVLGVDMGLLVGVAVNLVTLIYWCVHPRLQLVSETDYRDINLDAKFYHDVRENRRVVMARLSGSFNFSNATRVQEEAEELVAAAEKEAENEKEKPRYFLLDLSGVSALDLSACISLSLLCKNLRQDFRVKMGLVGVTGSAWRKLETCRVFDEVHRHRCFPTFQDALTILEHKAKKTK